MNLPELNTILEKFLERDKHAIDAYNEQTYGRVRTEHERIMFNEHRLSDVAGLVVYLLKYLQAKENESKAPTDL